MHRHRLTRVIVRSSENPQQKPQVTRKVNCCNRPQARRNSRPLHAQPVSRTTPSSATARPPRSSPAPAPSTGSAGPLSRAAPASPRSSAPPIAGFWQIAPCRPNSNATSRRYLGKHPRLGNHASPPPTGEVSLTRLHAAPRRKLRHRPHPPKASRAQVAMRMDLAIRFDYGRTIPWVNHTEDGLRAIAGPGHGRPSLRHRQAQRRGHDQRSAEFNMTGWPIPQLPFTLTYASSMGKDGATSQPLTRSPYPRTKRPSSDTKATSGETWNRSQHLPRPPRCRRHAAPSWSSRP